MIYEHIFLAEAQIDYEEALQWYIEHSLLAAENFIIAVDNSLALICKHPDRWRNEYRNYHEINLKNFPYSIVYTFEDDEQIVYISSLYHHKRNPRKKYRK